MAAPTSAVTINTQMSGRLRSVNTNPTRTDCVLSTMKATRTTTRTATAPYRMSSRVCTGCRSLIGASVGSSIRYHYVAPGVVPVDDCRVSAVGRDALHPEVYEEQRGSGAPPGSERGVEAVVEQAACTTTDPATSVTRRPASPGGRGAAHDEYRPVGVSYDAGRDRGIEQPPQRGLVV